MNKRSMLSMAAGALALALALPSMAQQPVVDKEYKLINPPQPVESKKPEVIEFFSYACPHCAEFEPALETWVKKRSKDIDYKMVPMVFREQWKAPAKLYYTLEGLGLVEKYHLKVYEAMHKQSKDLTTDDAVKEWAKSVGIDPAKFNAYYDSFGIDAKLKRSMTMGRAYGVQFTPAMAINGKYNTGPSMAVSPSGSGIDYNRFFSVVDQLIDMDRPKTGGKKTE